MKKLTIEEIKSVVNLIKFIEEVDLDEVVAGIKELFGDEAYRAVLEFNSEYNDESYDMRCSEITVYTKSGEKLKGNYENYDWEAQLCDLRYDLGSGECGSETDGHTVELFLDGRKLIPDLYSK